MPLSKEDMLIFIMKVKYLKVESRLYTQHLEVQSLSPFPSSAHPAPSPVTLQQPQALQTNYSIAVRNQYAFVLLHLKRQSRTKNSLSISIPEVCIFHNSQPYELIYNEQGEVRSYRGKEQLRLKEVFSFFKNRWRLKGLSKEEPCVACFQKQEYLMMTDTDLFIACRKFKSDPFFTKLTYIRNKVNAVDNPIQVEYESISDSEYTAVATESLINIQNQKEVLEKYGEYRYLKYCNAKICLYLNYQHNIRIRKGTFYYLKSTSNEYFFVNVSNLEFTNLTTALKQRQKRLKLKQQVRNQCLLMDSEKEERYRKHEKNENVQIIQKSMNQSWFNIAHQLRIKTNQERISQQQRNQKAFHVLYPSINQRFDIVLTNNNFKRLKKDVLHLEQRRSLFKSAGHQIKFNTNRCHTESLSKYTKRQ